MRAFPKLSFIRRSRALAISPSRLQVAAAAFPLHFNMEGSTEWAVHVARDAPLAPEFVLKTLTSEPKRKLLTLVIINDGERVLLGEKKRGFGEGYFNGFGGKVEPGETVQQAAQRELQEEACITADDLKEAGLLVFVFDDNPQPWEVHVFTARSFRGEPTETDEMRPVWFAHQDVPYQSMWADDPLWYPHLLRGEYFRGVFGFTQTTRMAVIQQTGVYIPGPITRANAWLAVPPPGRQQCVRE